MALSPYYSTYADVMRQAPTIGSISNISSEFVADTIGEVDAVINARISGIYSVPISPAPPLLQVISSDLSCYRIMRRSGQLFSGDMQTRSDWPKRFSEANSLLAMIVDGSIPLLTSSGAQIDQNATSDIWYSHANYTPIFDLGPMEEQVVDPDLITDREDARD